ncbi:hypothetical protein DSAG12_03872 [Promethearchaeum syntrophicum]|uniref:Uncharacterized protein n=1 Tax=Promethearchaeum syntrophicum TaxID=2594042 RepID=A0A5B9DFY4_9ARCH|nr:hypothetical protein [Candidatus Prometheoarchaeum syntrophicum]QEE18034.1 hypothetical protein DSAG12_03872 [Candidatus Prometheoarchaeum syntrophicum]
MASKAPILASHTSEENETKIQFKNNLHIFLMIFIPYVFLAYFSLKLKYIGYRLGVDSFWEIISRFFSDIFQADFLPYIIAVTMILILIAFIIVISKKEHKKNQFKSGMKAEETSEKSAEPILYRISVAGKEIKFSLIFSIIILILDIILMFTAHLVGILWGYNQTSEIIFYILLSISIIIAIISIWLSLKPREQEKGKNLILFGIQYLCFLVILSLTYWSETGFGNGIKIVESPQLLFLVIFVVSCLGIGVSLLSGSKKDQLNILFFSFYFTVGNFVSVFGYNAGLLYIKQFLIFSILSAVIGFIVIKYKNNSKIKINLPLILYGLIISGSSFAIYEFILGSSFRSAELTIHFIFIGIVFIVFQAMALIQLFINSSNLKEELSNDDNYLKMLYFIELIGIFPSWMEGWSIYTISIIILGILNFGLLFTEHKFKKNINLGALLLNLIVFITNILIILLSNWIYESDLSGYEYVEYQPFYIVIMGILTSITLAIPWFKEYRNKKKNLVEE